MKKLIAGLALLALPGCAGIEKKADECLFYEVQIQEKKITKEYIEEKLLRYRKIKIDSEEGAK